MKDMIISPVLLNCPPKACSNTAGPSTVIFTCNFGQTITRIYFAWYGAPLEYCAGYEYPNSPQTSNVSDIVNQLCYGEQSCALAIDPSFLPLPADPTQTKNLAVAVTCSAQSRPDSAPSVRNLNLLPGTTNSISPVIQAINCGSSRVLIIHVSYETVDFNATCTFPNAFSLVRFRCQGLSNCTVSSSSFPVDPCPHQPKRLRITAHCMDGEYPEFDPPAIIPVPPPSAVPPTPPDAPISPSPGGDPGYQNGLIIGLTVGAVVLVFCLFAGVIIFRKRIWPDSNDGTYLLSDQQRSIQPEGAPALHRPVGYSPPRSRPVVQQAQPQIVLDHPVVGGLGTVVPEVWTKK